MSKRIFDSFSADDVDDVVIEAETSTSKNKARAARRHASVSKALRKKALRAAFANEPDYYGNLHQYSKNKIHCSCAHCGFRTKLYPNSKTAQDERLEAKMEARLAEFNKGLSA